MDVLGSGLHHKGTFVLDRHVALLLAMTIGNSRLSFWEIATPACALVRNDAKISGAAPYRYKKTISEEMVFCFILWGRLR